MSLWEIIGTVLGVTGVFLLIRQNIWGWPVGLVQVSVYAWVFYGAKLYSDTILQGCFLVIQAYGWWHWQQGGSVRAPLPVTQTGPGEIAFWLVAGGILTAGWGTFMQRSTDAALPHWDAFILVFSLIAQWLQARKRLECWPGWLLVNTVAMGVYWSKDLRLTSGLYLIFWFMALWGWRAWRQSIREAA